MAGAGKKRQQVDRRRGGSGRGGSSSASDPAPTGQPAQSPTTQATQAQPPFGYDGSNSPPASAREPVQPSPQPGSTAAPTVSSPTPPAASTAGNLQGRDPAPPAEVSRPTDINRRLDLPPAAYNLDGQYKLPMELPRRPAQGNTVGKPVKIGVNSYNITKFPDKTIYQYDVHIGNGAERRALIRKVWESKTVQQATGPGWIFDGNRLAWAMVNKPKEINIVVDLDAGSDRPPRPGRDNKHRVTIRQTTRVALSAIDGYLKGKVSFDNSVLEAINFLDHLLRHLPSQRLTAIRQSFFARGKEKYALGGGVEAFKGVFQTIRACHGGRLAINVDVSNGSFWSASSVLQTCVYLTKARDPNDMLYKLKDVKIDPNRPEMTDSSSFKELRRLRKLMIFPRHRGVEEKSRFYYIDSFTKLGAREYKFEVRDKETGKTEETSVYDYFRKRYNITLTSPALPLIVTTKKGVVLPMEVSLIAENQKYPFKLDENQTSKMIKFAVTRPDVRKLDIEEGIKTLGWKEDLFLKNYGLDISPNMIETNARVLPPPTVQFNGNATVSPGTSGRWDLRGPRKFLLANTEPLQSWGVVYFPDRQPSRTIDKAAVQNFVREFIKTYQGHGGRVDNKTPLLFEANADAAKGVEDAFVRTANAFQRRPQILMFVLADKTAFHYARIKKSCDCRYGVLSQCVQASQVMKVNAQYMSNVCMKFNAKLGGATARVAGKHPDLGHFSVPSIVIGADVSHAAPGLDQPSMAAVTCSLDRYGVRYAAACETNGRRVEMLTTANIRSMVLPLVRNWIVGPGQGRLPDHVYYFRDGVSEGQFQHVLQQEVHDMKVAFQEKVHNWVPKFVVVVASKRHHIRFFPKPRDMNAADRNGNPLPGTLVEKDVTHPFENDFYLCSHSAIQGTARPVHYHVLLDEVGVSPNQLHAMIYEQCYAYVRSTTPVSLHPAVYYAHLASNRARSHEDIPASSGPRSGPDVKRNTSSKSQEPLFAEVRPLLPFGDKGDGKINWTMWYI